MWGSGEGEVREAYPGKLTSLDTLILGRWFSQNVASSLVIGAALGFWLLLVANLAQMPWRSNPQFGVLQSSQTVLSYVRFSGLLVLLSPIISALPIAILGLLLPITCAWRWFESKSRRVVFLCVLATLGCLWFGLQIYPLPAGLALTVVAAAFLVISFLYFDLLTTIATISAWSATSNLVNLGVNTSFGMTTVVLCSLGFGVFLLLELYFSFQGQRYSEVEVRPLYAEHLAQRQALQAEVSAAREAQLRLAPQALPQVEGLSPRKRQPWMLSGKENLSRLYAPISRKPGGVGQMMTSLPSSSISSGASRRASSGRRSLDSPNPVGSAGCGSPRLRYLVLPFPPIRSEPGLRFGSE